MYIPPASADRWTRLCLLLREAQAELHHTECREGDATTCPACDLESRIDSILAEEK